MINNFVNKNKIAELPVYKYEREIISRINSENILVIVGETGSGKTTQIPKILYNHNICNEKIICVTQPRRVAAISVALRVSKEMGTNIGKKVGYSVRFDEKVSSETKIKYVTDGMLLRECILDRKLQKYSVIILDEVHERSLNSDTILALVKDLILNKHRNDLKLIVMSATLSVDKFSSYLNTNNVIFIDGRSYPIEIYNTITQQKSYLDACLSTILQIHISEEEDEYKCGDILVFLPGQEDIEDLSELLIHKQSLLPKNSYKYQIFQLFSALPNQEQMKIFDPLEAGVRKIILSTNIAETSITINNIKYVVDSGFCKLRNYNPKSGLDYLKITKISKNSSIQRAGRAGREAVGKCFRLYLEEEFESMEEFNPPEILRINLRNIVLDLLAIGISDPVNFDFLDRPSKESFQRAFDELVIYKSINKSTYTLTDTGKKMSVLPVEPMFGFILINSLEKDYAMVRDDILTIISMLQTDNIFFTPSVIKEKVERIREKFIHPTSDHLTLLNVYKQWKENKSTQNWSRDHFLNEKSLMKADDIKKQLKNYLNKIQHSNLSIAEIEDEQIENLLDQIEKKSFSLDQELNKKEELIIKCLLTGYFTNVARYYADNVFVTYKDKTVCKIHPTSNLIKQPKLGRSIEFLIYNEIIYTNREYLKMCTLVRYDFIKKYFDINLLSG